MARRSPRPAATQEKTLAPLKEQCEQCGQPLWVANHNHRTVTTLSGVWKLTVVVRQCIQPDCPNYHRRQRPEAEGRWALPHGEFGLDVIALIGLWCDLQRRSGPEIHRHLMARGINISLRSVTDLMRRYKQLVEYPHEQIQAKLRQQGHVLLAIDSLQSDVEYEQFWVIRDCLSAEILLARFLRETDDLIYMLTEVKVLLRKLRVAPAEGLIINGKETIFDLSEFLSFCRSYKG